jgi:F-type H+-transporting ATPase subunit b
MNLAATLLAAEGTNPLLPHTYELVVGVFSFAVVVIVVGRILTPRIQKALADRTEAIEGGIKKAEDAQSEAQAVLMQYRDQLQEARQEAARLRDEAREQGAQIKAELHEEAKVEAQRIIAAAHAQIEADKQQALTQLRAEIGRLSTDLAGRIVGESLEDEARQRRIVDRFLEELENTNAAVR